MNSSPSCSPLFLLGPTGCGKSAVAVALAEMLGDAEIVSADAYQVYRGMEVLTAAPSAEELGRVPHHLVSLLEPSQNNDAATHARRAQVCLADLASRGKRAIVTGGSGLYVKFISHGVSEAPPSDASLRRELGELPLAELVRRLQKADPEGAAATDLQNPRYVARNLEIVLLGGRPLSYWRQNWQRDPLGRGFCLVRDTTELDERLARRTAHMLKHGAIQEVMALGDLRRLSSTASKTLGLSQIAEYLATRGDASQRNRVSACVPPPHPGRLPLHHLRDVEAAIALATRQYAKRQRTWLRRETWLAPVRAGAQDAPEDLARAIASCLGQ